jgi:hypothetical protein
MVVLVVEVLVLFQVIMQMEELELQAEITVAQVSTKQAHTVARLVVAVEQVVQEVLVLHKAQEMVEQD